jgi:hypothetical protein
LRDKIVELSAKGFVFREKHFSDVWIGVGELGAHFGELLDISSLPCDQERKGLPDEEKYIPPRHF